MASKRTVDLNQIAAQKPQANVAAAGYAAGATARRGAPPLKKYNEPPAGGQGPAIPALEQPFQPGQTMASQAVGTRVGDHHRQATQAVSALSGADSIVAGEIQTTAPPPGGVASVQDLQLIPTDALPQEATEDPAFRGGAGSMMAMQQPNMAAKYGVVRNGKHIPPEHLVRGGVASAQQRQRRSPQEIARDLNAVAEAQKKQPPAEKPESFELQAPDHLPRTDEEADAQAKEALNIQEQFDGMDDLDFDALRREMEDNELNSPKQRRAVEARLQPLSIEDLIMKNYVQQRVPIVPGAFEPTYRSVTGDIQLHLKKMLTLESEKTKVSDAYLFDKFALMTTTAGLDMINHHHAPTMYDERGNFSEERFWEKYKWVAKKPTHMLASLGTHYSWFEQRVRRLFKVDEGKGG